MELFFYYKGFGICYQQVSGTTHVQWFGYDLKSFPGLGMIDGESAAKEWINKRLSEDEQ